MKIDFIITSRLRYDYLDRTLDSLIAHNETNLGNIFVYEDSGNVDGFFDICDHYGVTPILGGGNKGQLYAIDYLMSFVKTDFYLHLEDDWECNEFGFIPEAIAMFGNPDITQVNGRGRSPKALNGHPVKDGYLVNDYHGWSGWMYAPTVNRLYDYLQRKEFRFHASWNPKIPWKTEQDIGKTYGGYKYVTEKEYFTHIGVESTIKMI